jgi:hypothetical protein
VGPAAADQNLQSQEDTMAEHMSSLCRCIVAARALSMLEYRWSVPMAFARLLDSDGPAVASALDYLSKVWAALMGLERLSLTDVWMADFLKHRLLWPSMVSVRATFLSLAASKWQLDDRLRTRLSSLFGGLTHTKMVEDYFCSAGDVVRGNKRGQSGKLALWRHAQDSSILERPGSQRRSRKSMCVSRGQRAGKARGGRACWKTDILLMVGAGR